MKITLNRLNDAVHFEMTNENGNAVQTDGSPDIGGEGKGVRPKDLLLMGAASCSAIDIVIILKKMRQELEDIKVEVDGDWEPEESHTVLRKLHMHYKLFGNIDEGKAKKAVKLSVEKYCSVSKTLEYAAAVTSSFEVVHP